MNYLAPSTTIDDSRLRELSHVLAAAAARNDSEARFPADNVAQLHQAGLLALTVPRRYGGTGAGLLETSHLLGALAKGCASTALILAMQLLKHAALSRTDLLPQQMRARIAEEAVERGALINTLRVEPELGSPTRCGLPATMVRRTPAGWKRCRTRRSASVQRIISDFI